MAVTERELQVLALQGGSIANAVDLELLLETFGDAEHELGHLRARRAVHCLRPVGVDPRRDLDRAVLELHLDIVVSDEGKLALRSLHLHRLTLDGGGNARRDRHRLLADT